MSKCDVQVFPWITRKCSHFVHVIWISFGCAVVFLNSLWFVSFTQSYEFCFVVVFANCFSFFCEGCYLFICPLIFFCFPFAYVGFHFLAAVVLSILFGFFCLSNEMNGCSSCFVIHVVFVVVLSSLFING